MKSFKVNLDELHCTIHFLMVNSKTHKLQVKKALSDLKRQSYVIDPTVTKNVEDAFQDCINNPGFTFQLCDTDVVVALREEFLMNDMRYFLGILVHECLHAIFFIFKALGLSTDDDEHMAIVMGNVVETAIGKMKLKIAKETIRKCIDESVSE